MDGRKVLFLMAATLLCRFEPASAATTACAADQGPAQPRPALERTTTDPATRAKITARRAPSGEITIDVVGRDASIRKTLGAVAPRR